MSLITGNGNKIFARGEIGNVRKAQEDSHGYKLGTTNGDLFVVCDGMGGHVGGATASRIAVDSIIGFFDQEKYASPVDALDGALQFANMQILGYATEHPELNGMGTTACIVLMQGDDVWIAHVGDSRIYLYLGNERQLHRITKDHSYVQTLVDAGEITDDEAEHHANKNRIMRALGIKPELHPTFNYENRPIHPKNGDVFLICSDGLSGMIPDSTIRRVMGESLNLHQKGERLIELAMIGETVRPGGQDNCTLEMIEVDNSPWTMSEFMSYNPKPIIQHPPVNLTPESPKPELPKQVKPQPKSNKRTIKIMAIVVAALIVVTVLAIFVSPAIHGYKIDQAEKKMAAIEETMNEKEMEMKEAQKALDEARKKWNQYKNSEANDTTKKQIEKSVNKAEKNFNKKRDDYYTAQNDYYSAVNVLKELNEKYPKSVPNKNSCDTESSMTEDLDDPE